MYCCLKLEAYRPCHRLIRHCPHTEMLALQRIHEGILTGCYVYIVVVSY